MLDVSFTLGKYDCEVVTTRRASGAQNATMLLPQSWIHISSEPPARIVFDLDHDGPCEYTLHLPSAWKSLLPDSRSVAPQQQQELLAVDDDDVVELEEEEEAPKQAKPRRKRIIRSPTPSPKSRKRIAHCNSEYSVADDCTRWESLDKVSYFDIQTKRDGTLFLDMHAKLLPQDDPRTEFIVTPDGEVCCTNGDRFGMFAYLENAATKYAPGKPHAFTVSDGELFIDIEWLKPADQLPHKLPSSLEDFMLAKHFSLPASAFCANLAHLTDATLLKWMPDYYSPLRFLQQVRARCKLGMWARETDLNFERKDTQADVLDLLEFCFVKPSWIWRCVLGEYIWFDFVQPVVDFGGKPQLELVEQLLNSRTFSNETVWERDYCGACGKQDVIKNTISIDARRLGVGIVCASRMEYIFDIGARIRALREASAFDIANAKTLVQDLRKLQVAYQDKQTQFNLEFSQ